MKIRESAENYLETVYMLNLQSGFVRSIDVANELGFSKPSVSVAMRKLRENGYVNIDNSGSIELSESGLEIAEKMYKRHESISKWLMSLGVSREQALIDACRIEHVISEESFACITKQLE